MEKYRSFRLALFFTAQDILGLPDDPVAFRLSIAPFLKDLKLGKAYLETFRSDTVPSEKLRCIKKHFEDLGFETATAIMPVSSCQEGHERRIGEPLCYTDPWAEELFTSLFRRMAAEFDEIIIDDSYLTNCTCDRCRMRKGDRDWADFRMNLLTDFLERCMVMPAREVNPSVRIILKYPTYNESFQRLGYDTERQPALVDGIYSGTETRHTSYSLFKNPRYTSFSLIRWLSNLKEKNNCGGWIDCILCGDANSFLEQANMTLFAKAPELNLFCAGLFRSGVWGAALGRRLEQLDSFLSKLGTPSGIPVYLPTGSSGEDHIYDFMGMCGIPCEPTAVFPDADELVYLTSAAAHDGQIIEKMRSHLESGGDVAVSTGFIKAMQGKGVDDFIWIRDHGQKLSSSEFGAFDFGWSTSVEYYYSKTPLSFPFLEWKVNDMNYHVMQMEDGLSNIILGTSYHAKGRVFFLNTPDNYSQYYLLPVPTLNKIRQYLSFAKPMRWIGQAKVGVFLYGNNTFVLQSFLPHGTMGMAAVRGNVESIENLETGARTPCLYRKNGESFFEIAMDQLGVMPFSYFSVTTSFSVMN